MSPHLNRAQLLYQQSRFDQAEQEVRQALLQEPHDSYAHALLGLCLMRQDHLPEAQEAAEEAIFISPAEPFPHYVRSVVLERRNRYDAAEASAREAVQMAPADADYHAQLASVLFNQKQWQAALDATLVGLQQDAEHAGCNNLRSLALTQLGRADEAVATVDENLARNPDDQYAHANKGYALLHQGQPRQALEHFREALRLDPNLRQAQAGIVEALQARNPIYRWILGYFLWMSRLSDRAKWGVVLGGYFGYRILSKVARANEELAVWIMPILIAYLAFVLMTWFSMPLFNLLLRLNQFGRHALSRDQRISSNWFGLCVLIVIGGCAVGMLTEYDDALLVALFGGGMALPLVTLYYCDVGWPRKSMTMFVAGMAAVGVAGVGCSIAEFEFARQLLGLFLIGAIAAPWLANYLASVTPTR
ncbi:tetratricopeptide repeat protein [Pirellulales bacterium]|nr:tetratricopeptide repeat protein [Pirellulales bacterium]